MFQIIVLPLLTAGLLQEVLIPEHHGVDQKDIRTRCVIRNQLFPENLDRVPPVKADLSIPALQETLPEQVRTWSRVRQVM